MDTSELIGIISRGEDSRHQFKSDIHNALQFAGELVAFSNTSGGLIFIGVDDDGHILGLTTDDVSRINQLISNSSSNNVRPPISPRTENIACAEGIIIVVSILEGISKPYMDSTGAIWVKSGSDKRRVTSREEMQRMFQASGIVHADETPTNGMPISDIDVEYFSQFLASFSGDPLESQPYSLSIILENMNLSKGGVLNIAGALLFAKSPQYRLPAFIAKCISYPGEDLSTGTYVDSIDAVGRISDIFQQCMNFLIRNTPQRQDAQDVNSIGKSMVDAVVFQELLANALIHRDYFIIAPIRIFVFSNRIEIISPGHLPNNLTVQNILNGNSNIRNPVLASFATRMLPYRGLGSGIRRALSAYPYIDFIDDREGNMFKVVIDLKAGL